MPSNENNKDFNDVERIEYYMKDRFQNWSSYILSMEKAIQLMTISGQKRILPEYQSFHSFLYQEKMNIEELFFKARQHAWKGDRITAQLYLDECAKN